MEELKNELKQAFSTLNSITILANQAEKVAMVKARITKAFVLLEDLEKGQKEACKEGKDGKSS